MARHILQFPTRNAFTAHDPLALDSQNHAHRIAAQVEREIAQQAQRLATGSAALRNRQVATMPQPSRSTRLRRMIAAVVRVLTPTPATRR